MMFKRFLKIWDRQFGRMTNEQLIMYALFILLDGKYPTLGKELQRRAVPIALTGEPAGTPSSEIAG